MRDKRYVQAEKICETRQTLEELFSRVGCQGANSRDSKDSMMVNYNPKAKVFECRMNLAEAKIMEPLLRELFQTQSACPLIVAPSDQNFSQRLLMTPQNTPNPVVLETLEPHTQGLTLNRQTTLKIDESHALGAYEKLREASQEFVSGKIIEDVAANFRKTLGVIQKKQSATPMFSLQRPVSGYSRP